MSQMMSMKTIRMTLVLVIFRQGSCFELFAIAGWTQYTQISDIFLDWWFLRYDINRNDMRDYPTLRHKVKEQCSYCSTFHTTFLEYLFEWQMVTHIINISLIFLKLWENKWLPILVGVRGCGV